MHNAAADAVYHASTAWNINLYFCNSCPCLYAKDGEIKFIYLFIYYTITTLLQYKW